MPEWIDPADAFRIILRGRYKANPELADEIKGPLWFRYSTQRKQVDVEAAREAFDLLVSEYEKGRIPSRGVLKSKGKVKFIDQTDAKSGRLLVWKRVLDCSLIVPGRIFRNVSLDKGSICRTAGRPPAISKISEATIAACAKN